MSPQAASILSMRPSAASILKNDKTQMDLSKEYYLPVPVDVKGHTPTMEFLAKVKSGEVQFSRSFETLVRVCFIYFICIYPRFLLTGV